jgi:hypothetical protein
MAYLRNSDPTPSGPAGCIFCDKPAEDRDAANLIVYRGRLAYVILTLYPYNNGHMLVVPYAHANTFEQLDPPRHRGDAGERRHRHAAADV